MKLKTLLIINAVIALVYGINLLVIPETVMTLHGITFGPAAVLMGRYFGATLLGVGLLFLLARDVTDMEAQSAIVLSMLILMVAGLIVSLQGTLTGVMNAVGWSAVAIYLFLGLGYAYFQFVKPEESKAIAN